MRARIIKTRARFFVAVEGDSEQSFVKWLQLLSEKGLHIHLDGVPLGGGGFKSMLQKAVRLLKRRCRTAGAYQDRFLVVDRDRAEKGDWSIEKLSVAARNQITVCVQTPNHEGLLLRMMPGMEHDNPVAAWATKLKSRWPSYQKPVNAHALARQFSLDDLLRVANVDPDLQTLLKKIGLMGWR